MGLCLNIYELNVPTYILALHDFRPSLNRPYFGDFEYYRKHPSRIHKLYGNDEMSGQGTLVWKNGAKYVGEWKEGMKDVIGKFTYDKESIIGH